MIPKGFNSSDPKVIAGIEAIEKKLNAQYRLEAKQAKSNKKKYVPTTKSDINGTIIILRRNK